MAAGNNDKTTDILVNGGALNWLANNQVSDNASINVTSGSVNYGTGNVTILDPNWTGGTNEIHGNTTFGVLNVSGGTNTISGTASPNITINSDAGTAGKIVLAGNVTSTVTAGTASITSGGVAANPGQLDLGVTTRTFTVSDGTAATDLQVSAQVIGSGVLLKVGAGTLALPSTNTYTGATLVNAGTLLVNGNISTSISTEVGIGGTLAGSGTVGALTVFGTLTPGDGGVGTLNAGNTRFDAGDLLTELNLGIEITGATSYDQLNVTGTVSLAGALAVTMGYTPANGALFFILANDSTDAIAGTYFSNASVNGGTYTLGGQEFQISYFGDTATTSFTGGNDVVLMAIPEPGAALLGGLGMLALLRRRRNH